MLKQRIITAAAVLPLMLGMVFWASDSMWAAFSGLIALLALWEYTRMSGIQKSQGSHYLAAVAVFGITAYAGNWQLPAVSWWMVLVFWLLLVPIWLYKKWPLKTGWIPYVTGLMLMLPFWFALMALRPNRQAVASLLAVMGFVWVADTAAYFFGKAFGKHKLAPSISPGKSWEGAAGAALCTAVYMLVVKGAGWLAFDVSWQLVLPFAWVLTAVSISGDLLESWFKRLAGIKDSGNLLPGHGGVFDRIDSLIAVLSVYAAISALLPVQHFLS